jgi:myo-inositol-1(or 4)-monophosphatase
MLWRSRLEAIAEAVHQSVAGWVGTEQGRESLTIGAAGDRTAMVDRVAEDEVIRRCEALHREGARFLLRSEELGDREFGATRPMLLVDPVDGSINAKQGLPYHCTSLALLDGETFGDAVVGVVRSLAGPGLFSAVRGEGVWRDGEPLRPLRVELRDGYIPVVLLEAVLSPPVVARHRRLLAKCGRVRLLGAAALSLCQAASGAASAFVSPGGLRSFDCAAGLLVLAEAGAVVTDRAGQPVDQLPADLSTRVRLVASLSPEVQQTVLSLLD